jgi:hypothetical protein
MFSDTWYDPKLVRFPRHMGTKPVLVGGAGCFSIHTGEHMTTCWREQGLIKPGDEVEVKVPQFPNGKCVVKLFTKLPRWLRNKWIYPPEVDYPGYAPAPIGWDPGNPDLPVTTRIPYALSAVERDAIHHHLSGLPMTPELTACVREVLRRLVCHS